MLRLSAREVGSGGSRVTNRICGNCRHFKSIQGATAGHCTNPLVVSHQGGLVMYREAEIGCRRGWKQDLWEPAGEPTDSADVQGDRMAAESDSKRAISWVNQAPSQPLDLEPIEPKGARQPLSDDDLLNPLRAPNAREAMRRAREVRKRELNAETRREPSGRPSFTTGEDSVIDERPVPLERMPQPIVPPVSAEEVRKHVDDARRSGRGFDRPMNISFRDDDDLFTTVPEQSEQRADSGLLAEPPVDAVIAEPRASYTEQPSDPADEWEANEYFEAEEPELQPPLTAAAPASVESDAVDWQETEEPASWDDPAWAQQAPWVNDDLLLDPAPQPRPKRRGLLGSLLHRREAAARGELRRDDELLAWESQHQPEAWPEPAPWPGEQPPAYAEPAYTDELRDEVIAPRSGDIAQLPPFPYDTDEESGEDYLLADSTFGEREEDDLDLARVPRICETCRYLRSGPNGPTCGAVYAQTYRRSIDLQRLSCASSIGAWWLPSDEYWESRVDISHHGDPTPLLEQYAIRLEERGNDDDLHTT